MSKLAERVYPGLSGAFLILGSVVFLWGGSQHPRIPHGVGDLEYFQMFAHHIVGHANWEAIHAGILAGPPFWVLGAVGLRDLLGRAGEKRWSTLALVALTVAAVCWSITFVFDGFVAPALAKSLLQAGNGAQVEPILATFRANQTVVIRLGLVSWLLVGIATAAFSISLAATSVGHRLVRWPLAAAGIALGIWPLIAMWTGVFLPGPFVSRYWNLTALSTGLWYIFIGGLLIASRAAGDRAGRPQQVGQVAI